MLKGTWVRPDGGYRIVIGSVGADGQIRGDVLQPDRASVCEGAGDRSKMARTARVPSSCAPAATTGSTYDLAYDPASDRLKGIYYQAVVKQKFDVYFVRK